MGSIRCRFYRRNSQFLQFHGWHKRDCRSYRSHWLGLLAFYFHSHQENASFFMISSCLSLSCLGFLPLNMPKARVFMGDIGSILLGAVFGSLVYLFSTSFLEFLCLSSFLSMPMNWQLCFSVWKIGKNYFKPIEDTSTNFWPTKRKYLIGKFPWVSVFFSWSSV